MVGIFLCGERWAAKVLLFGVYWCIDGKGSPFFFGVIHPKRRFQTAPLFFIKVNFFNQSYFVIFSSLYSVQCALLLHFLHWFSNRTLSSYLDRRPDFITLYFHEPDSGGHLYGPDSPKVRNNKTDGRKERKSGTPRGIKPEHEQRCRSVH